LVILDSIDFFEIPGNLGDFSRKESSSGKQTNRYLLKSPGDKRKIHGIQKNGKF
jgi:hypothetical protein